MTIRHGGAVSTPLGALLDAGAAGLRSDGELLERFLRRGDTFAFEVLVRRHGPAVLSTCRRELRHEHEAEDAFQATFLVLARRAGSVRNRDSVGPWLRAVASRVASRARLAASRRRAHERRSAELRPVGNGDGYGSSADESLAVLREEVDRLPEPYRAAVVLCHREGLTCAQAAERLGRPVGTVTVQLTRARRTLRDRLSARGLVGLAAWTAFTSGRADASAAIATRPTKALVHATVRIAKTAHAPAAGAVPASVAVLAEGVLLTMVHAKLTVAGLGLLVLASGAGLTAWRATAAAPRPAPQAAAAATARLGDDPAKGDKAKTDRDRLQGTWLATSLKVRGGDAGDEELKRYKMVFEGDNVTTVGQYSGGDAKGPFTLDTGSTPKTIDIMLDVNGQKGTLKGIYELDGDTLKVCYPLINQDRPAAFGGDGEPYLWVFKKAKG